MASEYRFVLFSWRDVREALVTYDRKRGQATPTVSPVKFRVNREALDCELTFGKDRPKRYLYDKASVVAALIMRCRDRGVRLPLKASKDLHLLEGRMAMSVHIAGAAEPEMLNLEILGNSVAA